ADLAEDDFESTRDGAENDGFEVLPEEPEIGEDAYAYSLVEELSDESGDQTVTTLAVAFLIENYVVEVSVVGFDEEPELDLAVEAAEVVEGKITSLIETGQIDGEPAPGLSMRTPRYEDEQIYRGRAHYIVYNGEAVVDAYDPASAPIIQERVDKYGIVAQYASSTELVLGDEGSVIDPLLRPRVTRFEREAGAERFVEEQMQELIDGGRVENVEEIDVPAGTYEDGAISAVSYQSEDADGVYQTTRLMVQDGRYVYDLSLTGITAPDIDVLLSVLDDAFACGQGGCAGTMEPPAELMNYLDEQRGIWLSDSDEAGS
ncbi:MAG: hypothetical protein ACRDHN_02980, partial [Thermomicrobiales bacterium]